MKYFARPNATRNITTEILNLLPESFNQHNLLIPRSLPRHCYFLGIGGIGMSALARYFRQNGVEVSGYDRIATPLTRRLEAEGMHIHYKDDPALIPPAFASPAQGDESLVVYTPAIPESHRERQRLIQLGYHLHKRSEILGMLSEQYRTLAVAGTHGKSTVSAMLAEIFRNSGTGCTAFLGAISKSIGSNYLYDAQAEWAVMEADEFDRSFLTLHPVQALVTSRDADHLDIYGTEEELQAAFNSFINRVTPGSVVILKKGVILTPDPVHRYRILSYALEDPDADYYAENLQIDEPGYKFDLVTPVATYRGWHTRIPGVLNVENSVAAAAMALEAGLYPGEVQKGLSVFDGLVRRLDIRFNRNNIIYMDDYAHHPNEIRALLHSVRALYPGRKITGIFQPHLFTRTRDFAAQFAAALEALDELLLLDIYPAREQPLPGITARIILDRIREIPAILVQKEQLPGILAEHTFDILLTIGAGDIDRLVEPITQYLEQHVT
ncbi:MAG: UDP-N-acetylmuramate--L-alanine ligase [Bacteroidales bacterium]|nr:UDP-N-acetylmuramate--L-alanine ligase [Bacteroidales bacterium]